MKKHWFLLILSSLIFEAYSLPPDSQNRILTIEKEVIRSSGNSKVNLQFKPGKMLTIKTSDGRKLISFNYEFQDSSIVMFNSYRSIKPEPDTIFIKDITVIKGKVFNDATRKAGGVILALSSPVLGFFPVFAVSFGGGPGFLVALPFIGLTGKGLSMTGARKFKIKEVWTLNVTEL